MKKSAVATFAGGCFWCTEAVFKRLKGVISVMPGYAGGSMENPDYDHVSMGNTENFHDPIVTQIAPFTNFYPAENYHQDYYEKHQDTPYYCRVVIDPKIQKLYRDFKNLTSI